MVKDLAARAKRSVEKTGWCAKEEVSSSFLGKLAPHTNIFLVGYRCTCALARETTNCCHDLIFCQAKLKITLYLHHLLLKHNSVPMLQTTSLF